MENEDTWRRLWTLSALLAILVGLCLWSTDQSQHYFAEALAQGRTRESVQVSGVQYEVDNGIVTRGSKTITGFSAWRPRKLAYEVSLARRDPFFNIAGTDPQDLLAQAQLLKKTEQEYAAAQKTSASSTLLLSLYPISFLTNLSYLEEKRQTLLADPTEQNAQEYEAAVGETAEAKVTNIGDFEQAFSQAEPEKTFGTFLYNGILAVNNEFRVIENLAADATRVQAQTAMRAECLSGWYFECTDTVTIPTFSVPPQSSAPPPTAFEENIGMLWRQAGDVTGTSTVINVQLVQSSCLQGLGPPYDIRVLDQHTDTGDILELSYADNIFFVPTDIKKAPFLAYLRTELGMEYTPDNTFKYYTCPLIGIDIGSVVALENIVAFAQAHPMIATLQRTKLLRTSPESEYDPLSEYDAIAYLNAAIAQIEDDQSDDADLHALEELSLMEEGRGGGLDQVVKDMVHVSGIDTEPAYQTSMDNSAKTIFATHSAFPSLFRIGAEDPNVFSSLYIETDYTKQKMFGQLVPYSTLQYQVPRSEILYDLRQFLILEGRYPSATSSSTS